MISGVAHADERHHTGRMPGAGGDASSWRFDGYYHVSKMSFTASMTLMAVSFPAFAAERNFLSK
jgi:hypothetical protein